MIPDFLKQKDMQKDMMNVNESDMLRDALERQDK